MWSKTKVQCSLLLSSTAAEVLVTAKKRGKGIRKTKRDKKQNLPMFPHDMVLFIRLSKLPQTIKIYKRINQNHKIHQSHHAA